MVMHVNFCKKRKKKKKTLTMYNKKKYFKKDFGESQLGVTFYSLFFYFSKKPLECIKIIYQRILQETLKRKKESLLSNISTYKTNYD